MRRAGADLNEVVQVIDIGVIAGPPPRTNACQFLSCVAAASRVLGHGATVPDHELWASIQADLAAVTATAALELRGSARASPRADPVGVAADYLRGHVCAHMLSAPGIARWLPSFAMISGARNAPAGGGVGIHDYQQHVHAMRGSAFADHQTLVEIAERLGVRISPGHKSRKHVSLVFAPSPTSCFPLGAATWVIRHDI